MSHKKPIVFMLLSFVLLMATDITAQTTQASATSQNPQATTLPNPVLYFMGAEYYSANGKDFTRYRFAVDNSAVYPDSLFAAAPGLPPCGTNTNSARTWVDVFDSRGKRLNGFCALGKASNLNGIWFALEQEQVPPSWVYIEMTDRQTNTKYKSNLSDTVQ